ncbi:hypothetical protein ABIA30_002982 [Mycobacterium sp. MAA66]|uniref:hypothetical protein n=1 Tax=Mycobacterium sp. MAA66 TaxID=3156297 RepID=UPI00351286D2
MNHKGLTIVITAAAAVALLAGCDSTTGGNPKSGVPSTGPSSTTTSPSAAPTTTSPAPPTINPTPKAIVAPPDVQTLAPQNGYVFIATKSGKTRCQVSTTQVGCESEFANAPQIDGESASGVRVDSDGKLRWVLGNLGAIPTVTIDYGTYSAVGWIISATADGTRFTNRASTHGMVISTSGVQAF